MWSIQYNSGGKEVGKTEGVEKVGEMQAYTQPTCNVGYSAGVTVARKNYSNIKLQVSLHLPCYVGEIDPVFEYASKWVDEKLNALMDTIPPED